MGFSRDESFYFRYSESYQHWFTRVGEQFFGDAKHNALGKKEVTQSWGQNSEHPPLMKVLFGFSWRWFGKKLRNVETIRRTAHDDNVARIRVKNVSPSDGFKKGDQVQILGPQLVNNKASDARKHLGWATVDKRVGNAVELVAKGVNPDSLKAACTEPRTSNRLEPHPWITGCQAATTSTLHFMRESTAMRFPAWVMAGILIALIFLLATLWFGPWVGLFAALTFLFIPRHFFHAHLCTFDTAVTTMIVAVIYAFWRSLKSRKWVFICSILWGLALLTKLNAFFIPIPLVAWWLITVPPQWRIEKRERTRVRNTAIHGTWALITLFSFLWMGSMTAACALLCWGTVAGVRIKLQPIPQAFLWMPPIGISMLFLLWPLLWYDSAESFTNYLSFHLNHIHYLQQYFGEILAVPPFPLSFPFTMTALTVPVVLLVLFGLGVVTLYFTERAEVASNIRWMILLNLIFSMLLIAMPETPIFGGIKHWLASMVFFALIAGYGFNWLRKQLLTRLPNKMPVAVIGSLMLAALFLGSSVSDSLQYRLFGTSYYNEIAGGVRGARDNGMHRQFWGYSGRYALDYLNKNAPRGSHVAFHNTTWDAVTWYQRDGLLRHDLRWRRDPPRFCQPGTFYVFHYQKSFAQNQLNAWTNMGSWVPDNIISVDGVPMLSIYSCKGRDKT